jgi:DNA-directed RNA polymerase beta subunit
MTVGELLETIAGLAALRSGQDVDGSLCTNANLGLLEVGARYDKHRSLVFDTFGFDEEELRTPLAPEGLSPEAEAIEKRRIFELVLRRMGYAEHGMKALFNPVTCELIGGASTSGDGLFNVGQTYMLRMNRIADYKMHACNTGPVDPLSRQGIEGNAKRFGEMEVACATGHGASQLKEDRLHKAANPFFMHVCSRCNWMCTANLREQLFRCGACREKTRAVQVFIPYDAKQLIQMIQVFSVTPTMQTIDVLN